MSLKNLVDALRDATPPERDDVPVEEQMRRINECRELMNFDANTLIDKRIGVQKIHDETHVTLSAIDMILRDRGAGVSEDQFREWLDRQEKKLLGPMSGAPGTEH